jgi:hypothetical protein
MSAETGSGKSRALPAVFFAGSLCGVLDINAAFLTWWSRGVRPVDILHVIASGLIGRRSFDGRAPTAALGLALHFLIAFSAAAVYYVASHHLKFMTQRPVISGIVYGVCVYTVMYWMVIPLSHYHPAAFSWFNASVAVVTHIVCVGLPISLVVSRVSK